MMNIFLIITGSIIGILIISVVYMRRCNKQYLDVVASIKAEEIPNISREALIQFQCNKLTMINFDDPLRSIDSLEKFIIGKNGKLKFPNFKGLTHMAWIIYTGVILGELMKAYTGIRWKNADEGPEMVFEKGDKSITAHPFEKVLKHERHGAEGELRLYVETLLLHRNEIMK